jgi:large subunit ribosomal protein L6
MSRVGNKPVTWKEGTRVSFSGRVLKVEAGKSSLTQELDPSISVVIDDKARRATFARAAEGRRERSLHGLYRSLCAGMVKGVEKGYEKRLDIQGVGYNAKVEGRNLVLALGFSKPRAMPIPAGLVIEVPTPTLVVIKGPGKQLVGQFAAEVRAIRPPEPYKGKGVRYEGEYVRRKVGKSLGTTT